MKIGDKVKYKGEHPKFSNKVGCIVDMKNDYNISVGFDGEYLHTTAFLLKVIPESSPIIPDHYKQGNIDTIAFCESFFTKEQLRGAYRFNVIKYNHRYLDKNGLEDLKKAEFYLQKLIELENTNEID